MTEEEKIVETEKTREKYFYIDKEKTYSVLTSIATSFIGAGLALVLFGALHKPPVPPCGFGFNKPMPCPMKMMPRKHHNRTMQNRDFRKSQDFRGHRHVKRQPDFKKSDFNRDRNFPPQNINRDKKPFPPIQKENVTPKK